MELGKALAEAGSVDKGTAPRITGEIVGTFARWRLLLRGPAPRLIICNNKNGITKKDLRCGPCGR